MMLCRFSQSERTAIRVKRTGFRTGKDSNLKIMRDLLRAVSALSPMLALSLSVGQGARCYAQTQAQAGDPPKVAVRHEPSPADTSITSGTAPGNAPSTAAPDSDADVAKELAIMKARIEQLEAELKSRAASAPAAAETAAPVKSEPTPAAAAGASPAVSIAQTSSESPAGQPEKTPPSEPFAYADWTWLNGTARNKDAVWDSKFFTPEIRFDTDFVSSFNHPKDDTLGGSTEIFRSNEIQVEQISFGGDFHWQNVRGRVLTLGGMFAVTTPRNDASPGRGQWDLRGA